MGINYKKLIAEICDRQLDPDDRARLNPRWREIADLVDHSRFLEINSTAGLKEFLIHVYKRGSFLETTTRIDNREYLYAQALIKVFERNRQWLRKYSTWKPRSHNRRKQFSHLLRHLFGKYDIPVFMDNVWFRIDPGSYRYRDWYVNLTRGESLRQQKSRILVTRKMAHYFGTAPADYSVEEALWWGIVLSLGGNERIAFEFNASRPSQIYLRQDFWKNFIRYLVANPLIDPAMIGPIVDFINFQKFDTREYYENDAYVTRGPPQPNFSLANRSPDNLLRLVQNWHRSTSQINAQELIKFDPVDIKPYPARMPRKEKPAHTIRQLTNNRELLREGEIMSHCVGSYVTSCQQNRCSIWSLCQHEPGIERKLVTIAVNADREIDEARGKFNRYPNKSEYDLIARWAAQEKLAISPWVIYE